MFSEASKMNGEHDLHQELQHQEANDCKLHIHNINHNYIPGLDLAGYGLVKQSSSGVIVHGSGVERCDCNSE